jgi:hypothetical protein
VASPFSPADLGRAGLCSVQGAAHMVCDSFSVLGHPLPCLWPGTAQKRLGHPLTVEWTLQPPPLSTHCPGRAGLLLGAGIASLSLRLSCIWDTHGFVCSRAPRRSGLSFIWDTHGFVCSRAPRREGVGQGTRCVSGGPRGCSRMGLVGLK